MEGSIIQLGLGNYLIDKNDTSNSFFKHQYKNYANYVKHTKKLNFKSKTDFGSTISMNIDEEANYGDLITNMVLEIDLPDISSLVTTSGEAIGYCNGVGNSLIKRCDLKIGGNVIDQQDGDWMNIWSQLAIPSGKQNNYDNMIKKSNNFTVSNFTGGKIFVPLFFWFCQNTNFKNNFSLPLVSLRNNNIELIIELRTFLESIFSNDGTIPTTSLNIENISILIDYVILNEKERINYLESKFHVYLMHQVQSQKYDIVANTTNLNISMKNFKYPIIELFVAIRRNDNETRKNYFNYSDSLLDINNNNPIDTIRLTLDGKDRIEEMSALYFTQVEPSKIHDNIPNSYIHCYSFALEPENLAQPSGTCNFSEIYEPMLHIKLNDNIVNSTLFIYTTNYNVLQIDKSGNSYLLHNLSKSAPTVLDKKNKCD